MHINLLKVFTFLAATFILSSPARAADLPQYLNFDGQLDDGVGNPITTSVNLTFRILDPSGNCLLYEETRTGVTPDAAGQFSVKIGPNGGGSRNSAADGGLLWKAIFQNDATVRTYNSTYCPNPSGYIPAAGDARKLRVIVNATTLSPDYILAPVPYATVAESLQGKTAADFISASGNASINGYLKLDNQMEMRFSDGSANYVAFRAPPGISTVTSWALPNMDGTTGQVLQTNGSGQLSWTTPVSGGISSLNGLTGGAQTFNTGTSGSTPSFSSSGAIHTLNIPNANNPGTTAGLLSYADWTTFNSKQSSLGFTPLNSSGGSMTGVLTMNANIDMNSLYRVTNLASPISAQDAVSKSYVDSSVSMCVLKAGDAMSGALTVSNGGTSASPSFNVNGHGMYSPVASTLGFAVSGVERMRIDNTGRVGIGTTSLSEMFNIEGNASPMMRINSTDGSSAGIKIHQSGVMKLSMVSNSSDSYIDSGAGNTMQMRANMYPNQLVLVPSGSIGIGTNAPTSTVDVSKTMPSYSDVRNYNSDVTGGARYVVGAGGGVGTGALSLETQGASSSFGAGGDAREPSGASIWWSGTNGPMSIASATEMRFYSGVGMSTPTAAFEQMRIDPGGNVGIGTTSPTAKLDVYGPVKIGPSGNPVQMIKNFPAMGCSFTPGGPISPGSTATCTLSVGIVNTSDNAAVNCQPVSTPSQPIIHSCFISAASQITLAIHNVGASGLTPPTSWNITVIKF